MDRMENFDTVVISDDDILFIIPDKKRRKEKLEYQRYTTDDIKVLDLDYKLSM